MNSIVLSVMEDTSSTQTTRQTQTWCLWSAPCKVIETMWTAARSPALCWPPAPPIRASAFTPHETSASCPSPRCPDTATGCTAAASAPAVSTWPPAPPMPPPWCGRWTPERSRPSWSIRAGVRWGCAPSLQTPLSWCPEAPMGPSHCGSLPPGPCAGTSDFHYWSRHSMSSAPLDLFIDE